METAEDSSPVCVALSLHCSSRKHNESKTASHLHNQSLSARQRCTARCDSSNRTTPKPPSSMDVTTSPINPRWTVPTESTSRRTETMRSSLCSSFCFLCQHRSESPQNSTYSAEPVPDIPRPSLLQLSNRRIPVTPNDVLSPLPAPAQNTRPQETVFHLTPSLNTPSQEAPRVPMLFTPPHPRTPAASALRTPPLEPREYHQDMAASLLQRPPSMLFLNPPAAPLLHPLAVPVYEPVQVVDPIRSPRYIAKVSLLGNSLGKIVSKIRIPGRKEKEVGRRQRHGVFLANIS